jgi:tetratricopeptide (TPR) repeat protein
MTSSHQADTARGRRRRWRVGAVAAALLLGVAAFPVGRQLWAWQQFHAARAALTRRDFPQAGAHARACLAVWPDSADAHLLAAQAARRAGRPDEAQRHVRAARRLPGPAAAVEREWALLRAQEGDLAAVRGYLDALAEAAPALAPGVWEALAQGCMQVYQLDAALVYLQLLLEREPDHADALLWRARLWDAADRKEDAEADFRRAVACRPAEAAAHVELAEFLERQSRHEEAAAEFVRATELRQADAAALLGLARCRRVLGDTAAARALVEDLLARLPDDTRVLAERGRLALAAGRHEEAARWLRRAAGPVLNDSALGYQLYQCLQACGRAEEARQVLDRLDRFKQDQQRLKELVLEVARAPRDPAPRCQAGLLCLRNGQEQEGLRWLAGALQVDSGYAPARDALAEHAAGATASQP